MAIIERNNIKNDKFQFNILREIRFFIIMLFFAQTFNFYKIYNIKGYK